MTENLQEDTELQECQTAGAGGGSSIESVAPENTVSIVNGQEKKESIRERIQARKLRNQSLKEAKKKDPDELTEDDLKELPGVRYRPQTFSNGGTPKGYDDDGNPTDELDAKEGEPSAYEKWRRSKIDKGRKARLQQLKADQESEFRSPDATFVDRKRQLDENIDDFLYSYIQEHGEF